MAAPELYFYWRVRPGSAAAAAAALERGQAQWRADLPTLTCRLLRRRAEDDDGVETWMEVYARPAGLDAAWQARLRAEGDALLAPWIDGRRHLEVFEPHGGTVAG